MIGMESLAALAEPLALVGAVLVEALVLYVGYAGLERIAGERVKDAIPGD